MGLYDRTYYGGATDIALAKQQGLQGNFYDISGYGEDSKYQDLLHAYKTGANPVILGGAGATGGINDAMYQRLMGAGANIQRIGGKDRYEVQNNFKNYANALGKQRQVSDIYDQQQKSQLDALKAQRDKAIGGINQQKAELAPKYQSMRNQADVVNQQNVTKLRELMAANGIGASGENITAQAGANSQRQQSLNDINIQEQQQVNDYNRQINDLNNPAQEQQIIAQLQAQKAQALLDAQNRSEDQAYQREQAATDKAWREYTFNNMSASEKAQLEWAKSQYGEDAAWKMFELKYNGEIAKAQSGFNQATGGVGGVDASKYRNYAGYDAFQKNMSAAIKEGVDPSWAPLLTEIVKRESSFNPGAKNPKSTAYGYGQFLTSTRQQYEKRLGLDYGDPVNQIIMMAQYVKDRYGTPEKALAFWNKNHWY